MMRAKRANLILLLALVLVAATACTSQGKQQGMQVKNQVKQAGERTGRAVEYALPDTANNHPLYSAKATHLADLAKSVPSVNNAYCLSLGNLAIVGIDVPANLERSRIDTIKYTVAETLKKDPEGANALVTADLDLAQSIRDISVKVQNGHPVAAFADELGDILGRLIPQLPQDTHSQDQAGSELPNPSGEAQGKGAVELKGTSKGPGSR
ncbi:YhcN/YlaJ family sporulation lipoprotein [Gorillibacterium timonense]|uniref:YhcN/YlaJ family sporulation lipoprotein n=1 Tax=Gorillibacterium timonense TaxID=1689269 RepID=UPI00071CA6CD|nr:YhcN/YlaJ family sporulation lipoprotein [Gorillibacterium timonense]